MSGNNPHGHLSQPQNSSWNPLQLEQLNPLLPSFVRAPSPFDSMDLSLQSNRNSSSPLTKGLSASVPPEFGHKPPPPPPPPSHSQNNFPIHNLSTNSGVHHTQSMSAGPPPPLPKYMNTNGNDVDMQQQACGLYIRDTERINDDYAKMTNRSCENDIQSNLTKPVELVKECTYTNLSNKLIPSSPKKISPPPIQQQQHLQHQLQQQQLQHHQQHQQQQQQQQQHHQHQHQHQHLQQQTQHQHQHQQQQQQQQQHHQLQQHQQQHQQQQQYSCSSNGPNSPENSRLTNLSNFTTPLNHLLTESTSGSCLPPKCATDLTTANATENSCNSLSTNDSPANVTSNEDSVDSSGSRTRRKRKPNKTVRMSHDSETDENISLGEQATHQGKHTPPSLPTIVDVSNSNGSLSLPPELGSSQQQQVQENISYGDHRVQEVSEVASVHQSSPPVVDKQPVTNDDRIDIRSSSESDEHLHSSEIINNNQTHRSDSDDVETIDKIAEMIAKSSNNSCAMISDEATSSCSNGSNKKSSSSPVVLNDDEDDIDKSPPLNAQQDTRTSDVVCVEPLSADSPSSKPNDLKSIFETSNPPSPNQTSHKSLPSPSPPPGVTTENAQNQSPNEKKSPSDNKSDNAKSTFEEVEYKLEEMFAGIEDEPQRESTAPADDTAHSEVTTDLSLALALPTTKIKDDDEDSEHKPLSSMASTSNAVQKRLHSTPKNEQGPAKKKARLAKKPSNKKSKGKASTSVAGTSKTSVAQGNKSKGGGTGGGGGGGGGGPNNSKTNNSTAKIEDPSLAAAAAETKYKGPYVLVKPDGTINVINAPIAEDESEKVSKVKKGPYTHVDRSKLRGIHMSTLGNKYDADTADATWMCVFCKKGPHKFGLGDLFGPYIITTKCEDYESAEKDDVDSEFVSRRKKCEMFQKTPYSLPIVPSAHSTATCTNSKKKKKTSESHATIINDKSPEQRFFGMSKVSDTSYEVWMHEDCAVWAPGVFLIGARIVGLESSVWSSTNYTCSICTQKGAMICCLHRGCDEKAHIPCARLSTWDLNETDFKIYCEKHAVPVDTSS